QARVFATGMLLMALGAAGLALWRGPLWQILLELAALGVGFGLSVGISGAVVTAAVAPDQTGVATAFNSVLRRVGGAIGAQVSAALLITFTGFDGQEAAATAFTVSFAASAIAALAGTVCALLITPRI